MIDTSTLALTDPLVIGIAIVVILAIIGAILYYTGNLSKLTEKLGF